MKRLLLALVAGFAAIALIPSADATHGSATHWAGTGDREVRLISSVTSGWRPALDAAVSDWSESDVIDLVVTQGSTRRKARKRCKARTGAIRVCNYNYGRTGWAGVAITTYETSSKHIVRARAKLNTRYVKNDHNRRVVSCHEIGHTLGIGEHNASKGSCLFFRIGTDISLSPNAHDYDELEASHGHAHATAESVEVTEYEHGPYTTRIMKLLAR